MSSMADFVMPGESNEADRSLVVRFSVQPRLDSEATAKEGREVYKDVEFITILIPGDKTLTVHRPVRKQDFARFPTQYQAFKHSRGALVSGTPLAGWPLISESQRRELEYFNILTVEQLSEVNDGFAGSMMGVHQLKQTALRYISAAKEKAPAIQFTKALEERDAQIAALQDQLNKLASLVTTKTEAKAGK